MWCIPTLLSSFTCSLFARSTKQGPTIYTEDDIDGPTPPFNTDAYIGTNGGGGGGGGGGGTDADGLSTMSTPPGKDPPFMLPLITGGFILALVCAMWFGWRWYDRRARINNNNGEVVEQGDGGEVRTSTRMHAAPPPKLWEVEINMNRHVGPISRVSLDDEEEEEHLTVRKSVI